MKKELKFEELSIRQKLGMVMIGHIYKCPNEKENTEYALEMIRNRSLGAIWVEPNLPNLKEIMAAIDEAADYPILIITDAEKGIGEHIVGRHNSIGCTDSDELAYMFGKVTGVTAQNMGYNVICAPLLDMCHGNSACGHTVRSLGSDKVAVSRLARNIARGLHDGGVLTVAKHYPGSNTVVQRGEPERDSHMCETLDMSTKEELLNGALYPYLDLMKHDLLDALMVKHTRFPNIDPDNPATLSSKVIGVIREQGFDGIAMTDALEMMGIVAKYGIKESKGLVIARGNDLALTWIENKFSYEAICETYDKGLIPDERIDEAVRRVLCAHSKVNKVPKFSSLTKEDIDTFERINIDCIYEKRDEGVSPALSTDEEHLFVVLAMNEMGLDEEGNITNDTMNYYWYRPGQIVKKIKETYPKSTVRVMHQFSSGAQNWSLLCQATNFKDVIFVTFNETEPNIGKERLTTRTLSVIDALQVTDKVSALIHVGNPFVLEELVHIPRVLVASTSTKSALNAIDVLAGKYPAKGKLTYDVHIN